MTGVRFWNATERAESDFTGRADVTEFRQRMRRLGHDASVIRQRVEDIRPELLAEFDALPKLRGCTSCRRLGCDGECLG